MTYQACITERARAQQAESKPATHPLLAPPPAALQSDMQAGISCCEPRRNPTDTLSPPGHASPARVVYSRCTNGRGALSEGEGDGLSMRLSRPPASASFCQLQG